MEFTIEIYKADKRKKVGKILVDSIEVITTDEAEAVVLAEGHVRFDKKLSYEVHATFRKVRNVMTGKVVEEHFRTPWACSVASEAYWSA